MKLPIDSTPYPQKRHRRRRNFLQVLQQSQLTSAVPMVNVGERLRDIRNDRGLSIRALAEMSQLNVNTLSMIENGKTSPSVATLQQLAFALEIPIAAFFENGTPKNKIVYLKASQRAKAAFAHGTLEDLGAGMVNRGAEPFLVVLEPHADSGLTPIIHTGREFVFCLEGKLAYVIDDQEYILEPGDSQHLEAYLPHRWQNIGATPTRSLLVLCPSDEHDRPTERHFIQEPAVTPIKQTHDD